MTNPETGDKHFYLVCLSNVLKLGVLFAIFTLVPDKIVTHSNEHDPLQITKTLYLVKKLCIG